MSFFPILCLSTAALVVAASGIALSISDQGVQGFRFKSASEIADANATTAGNVRTVDSPPADSVPAPWYDTRNICAPSASGRSRGAAASVCDPSGLLMPRQMDILNNNIYSVYQGQSPHSLVECPPASNVAEHGFRIAIITVRSIPADGNTLAMRARLYAEAIFTKWDLANNCGASVLVLLAWDDRRLFIKTGSLASRYVTNIKINDVFQMMTKYLQNGNIYPALDTAVNQLSSILRSYHPSHTNPQPPSNPAPGTPPIPKTDDGPFGPLFFKHGPSWWDLELSLVVVMCAVCLVTACCHGFGGPDAARLRREKKTLLRKLDVVRTEYIRASMPQYEPSSCPVCQEQVSEDGDTDVAEEDEGDPLTGQKVHDSSLDLKKSPRSIKKYPCGHFFHESCLQSLPSRPSGCPVCEAGKPGADVPSLSESRGKDFSYRLERLRNEYPHLLTVPLLAQLHDSNPTTWPDRLEDAFLSRGSGIQGRHGYSEIGSGRDTYWQGNDGRSWGGGGGTGAGGMLAAGAAGVGAGWLLNNAFSGGQHDQQQQQQQLLQQQQEQGSGWNAEGGMGTSWSNNTQVGPGNQSWFGQQSADDGAGQGTGWGNAADSMSQAFSAMSGGWGGGSSQAGGDDDGGGGDGTGW